MLGEVRGEGDSVSSGTGEGRGVERERCSLRRAWAEFEIEVDVGRRADEDEGWGSDACQSTITEFAVESESSADSLATPSTITHPRSLPSA